MKFKFDPNQQYQLDAIDAVVDLFDGQPHDAESLVTAFMSASEPQERDQLAMDVAEEVGAIGNNLLVAKPTILENLKEIQDRNGLEVQEDLVDDGLDFDIEMETGTGKTYVYLRTVFELAKEYGFTKFVVLVPSVAIREGVVSSIELMRDHFYRIYSTPFDVTVYSGRSAEEVQPFATSTSVQIMIMTIDSIRGDKNTRIIRQYRDQLNGLRPIDYLSATRPVVIMDEPQNMESELSQSAIEDINPLCTLRYSATHRVRRNLVYQLDPVDAHDLGLVKQIVVADVVQEGADAKPYVKLLDVRRDPWRARLELAVRKKGGAIERKSVTVRQGDDLAEVTGNPAYDNNWRLNEVSLEPAYVELTNHGLLQLGEAVGASTDAVHREMIRESIREHLRKEQFLRPRGIKVLTLFFVDQVSNYLTYADDGTPLDGKFAEWFDEMFIQERSKFSIYQELLPQEPNELRAAYFSVMTKRGVSTFVDSTERGAKRDIDTYDLIMRDKARLLDQSEPTRFIFSHSALREGWDNPNVFQICALREMGKSLERRQTIGRGLRLPVNQEGVRVREGDIAQLSVIANESYQAFAENLQADYVRAGVSIGHVRLGEFAKLKVAQEDGRESVLGYKRSAEIWKHLNESGFIDDEGTVLATFRPEAEGSTLNLPPKYEWAKDLVVDVLESCKIEHIVKTKRKRRSRTLNKELYFSEDFKEFWSTITQRTTYRVHVDRDSVITKAGKAIKQAEEIPRLRIRVTKANISVERGGMASEEKASRESYLGGSYPLPDIIAELQEATSLTRSTIVDILVRSDRLTEFIGNPNGFLQMVKRSIQSVLAEAVVEGIQYERLDGSVYELRELQQDGQEERDRFIDQLYEVKNQQKTDFDYVVYDSGPEREFAKLLDSRDDIKLFMKLPPKFKVPTPVGDYNPDWAIIKQEDGEDRIYMIRETKSTSDPKGIRPTEQAKINCGKKHFAAIGVSDFAKSTPSDWNL